MFHKTKVTKHYQFIHLINPRISRDTVWHNKIGLGSSSDGLLAVSFLDKSLVLSESSNIILI